MHSPPGFPSLPFSLGGLLPSSGGHGRDNGPSDVNDPQSPTAVSRQWGGSDCVTCKPGTTASQVAADHNMSWSQFLSHNPGMSPNTQLRSGDTVVVTARVEHSSSNAYAQSQSSSSASTHTPGPLPTSVNSIVTRALNIPTQVLGSLGVGGGSHPNLPSPGDLLPPLGPAGSSAKTGTTTTTPAFSSFSGNAPGTNGPKPGTTPNATTLPDPSNGARQTTSATNTPPPPAANPGSNTAQQNTPFQDGPNILRGALGAVEELASGLAKLISSLGAGVNTNGKAAGANEQLPPPPVNGLPSGSNGGDKPNAGTIANGQGAAPHEGVEEGAGATGAQGNTVGSQTGLAGSGRNVEGQQQPTQAGVTAAGDDAAEAIARQGTTQNALGMKSTATATDGDSFASLLGAARAAGFMAQASATGNDQSGATTNPPPPPRPFADNSVEAARMGLPSSNAPVQGWTLSPVTPNANWSVMPIAAANQEAKMQILALLLAQAGVGTMAQGAGGATGGAAGVIDPQALAAQVAATRTTKVVDLGDGRVLQTSLVKDRMGRVDAIARDGEGAARSGDVLDELRVRREDGEDDLDDSAEQRQKNRRRRAALAAVRRRRRPHSVRCRRRHGVQLSLRSGRYPTGVDLTEFRSRQVPRYLWAAPGSPDRQSPSH